MIAEAIIPYARPAVQLGGMLSVLVVIASLEYAAVGRLAPPSDVFTLICNGFAPIWRVPRYRVLAEYTSQKSSGRFCMVSSLDPVHH